MYQYTHENQETVGDSSLIEPKVLHQVTPYPSVVDCLLMGKVGGGISAACKGCAIGLVESTNTSLLRSWRLSFKLGLLLDNRGITIDPRLALGNRWRDSGWSRTTERYVFHKVLRGWCVIRSCG